MAQSTWTKPDDIVDVWRPLRPAEAARAPGLIAFVERGVRREWPSVAKWIADGALSVEDLKDVVVWMVVPILAPDVDLPVNAKAWQETSGSESRSVTLDGAQGPRMLTFLPWMVRVFDSVDGAKPSTGGARAAGGGFGDRGPIGNLFESGIVERRYGRGAPR